MQHKINSVKYILKETQSRLESIHSTLSSALAKEGLYNSIEHIKYAIEVEEECLIRSNE